MALAVTGLKGWKVSRDTEGHRTYKIKLRVQGQTTADGGAGPALVLQTPGLPFFGDVWLFNDDLDVYAYRKQETEVEPVVDDGDPVPQWDVTCTFSTIPETKRCHENQIDDPLLTPDRVSGDSIRYTQEETIDRFGNPIRTSSHEQIRGQQVEFDRSRDQVIVEQNVALLELDLLVAMRDTLNATEQWGLPTRCIKLSSFSWERKFYGLCNVYYTRRLIFETNVIQDPFTGVLGSGWDRDLLDEGTKVLHGHWSNATHGTGSMPTDEWVLDNIDGNPPDPNNPGHFDQFKDRNGENCRVVLNGRGRPAFTSVLIPGGFYVALQTFTFAVPLSNSNWLHVASAATTSWIANAGYPAGTLVTDLSSTYVSIKATTGQSTAFTDYWTRLPGGVTNKGLYIPGHIYSAGDVVQSTSTTETAAGKITVQKYTESNFFLLGIPTSF